MKPIKKICGSIWRDIYINRVPLCIIAVYMVVTQILFGSVCPMVILFHRVCPACGLTRAGLSLMRLDFAGAWKLNPSIYIWVPFIIYLCICRYILCKKPVCATAGMIAAGIATIAIFLF
jgi:hypothetical protein